MSHLIGLTGLPSSGKDTVAKHLIDNYEYTRLAFADAVREALYALNPALVYTHPLRGRELTDVATVVDDFGWDTAKQDPEVRRLLQRMGTEAGRHIHGGNAWVKIVENRYLVMPTDKIVITDVRFPEEVKFIHEQGGHIANVRRPSIEADLNERERVHASENQTLNHDFTIFNNGGLADLEREVDDLIEEIGWHN